MRCPPISTLVPYTTLFRSYFECVCRISVSTHASRLIIDSYYYYDDDDDYDDDDNFMIILMIIVMIVIMNIYHRLLIL